MSEAHREYVRQRRVESLWRSLIRTFLPAPSRASKVIRITSTGYPIALVPPRRGPRSGEASL